MGINSIGAYKLSAIVSRILKKKEDFICKLFLCLCSFIWWHSFQFNIFKGKRYENCWSGLWRLRGVKLKCNLLIDNSSFAPRISGISHNNLSYVKRREHCVHDLEHVWVWLAGDWQERPGRKVLEIWPVPSFKVKSFAKSNRFKAIFTGQKEAKDKSQVG